MLELRLFGGRVSRMKNCQIFSFVAYLQYINFVKKSIEIQNAVHF